MKACSYLFSANQFKASTQNQPLADSEVQLIIGFGNKQLLADTTVYNHVRQKFSNAQIVLGSTAGEIFQDEVLDGTLSLLALQFDKTKLKTTSISVGDALDCFDAGVKLGNQLVTDDLAYVFILSDGGRVNGSELVRGIEQSIPSHIPVTGGLAGDGSKFEQTLVGLNEVPVPEKIIAIGFYGKHLKVGHGSMGGWEMFGLEKTVTKSVGNELFEIDGKRALDVYKTYLGKYADELPGSALLFPLSVKLPNSNDTVVRTILSINDENQSMVFAGDIHEGAQIRFMKANFDQLIDAATTAAQKTFTGIETNPKVAILISCVGRKLVLDQRVDEEVEAVVDTLGSNTIISGFYSYGEISPLNPNSKCELHNQTMTITTLDEI